MTRIDSEDTVSISKLAKVEKNTSAANKRLIEALSPDAPSAKKSRSYHPEDSGSFSRSMIWAPEVMVVDKSLTVSDSVI